MNAGDLRHMIILIPPGTPGKDADGFNTIDDGLPITVKAARENLHGTEGMEAARVTGRAAAKFTIRYLAGLTNHWKLTAFGVEYNILYVDDIRGLHRWIEILAEAVV
jgi:SPP1 family predicted phage head-tail adaptor